MSGAERPLVEVTFLPDGQRVQVPRGRRILGVVLEAGRPIGRSCRGAGVCLACGVWVEGPASVIEPDEAALIGRRAGETARGVARWRIACLARILGDVRIGTDYW